MFMWENIVIKGIKIVISISKIKKINLIIKNCTLKGIRLFDIGSNPHSKGEDFSRLKIFFLEIKKLINIMKIEINIKNKVNRIKFIINYIN